MMLNEATKQTYLQAMGVTVWQRRVIARVDIETVVDEERAPSEASVQESSHDAEEVYKLSSEHLSDWLSQQTLLPVLNGDVVVNRIGPDNATMLVLSECVVADKVSHQPFSGDAGQLLSAMLKAIQFYRSDICIAELDTPAQNDERSLIEMLSANPIKTILLLLDIPAQHSSEVLDHLRNQVYKLGENVQLIVSYHPLYLLKNPQAKRKAWEDLQALQKILEN